MTAERDTDTPPGLGATPGNGAGTGAGADPTRPATGTTTDRTGAGGDAAGGAVTGGGAVGGGAVGAGPADRTEAAGGGAVGDAASAGAEVDLARVRAEIDEEVRLRRASRDFPITLDRELDDLFEELAPGAKAGDELSELIDRAEEAAYIDLDVPTASRIPGGSLAKRLIAKVVTWFATHLARQTTTFATAASRSLRLLLRRVVDVEERVRALEDAPDAARARLAAEPRPAGDLLEPVEWAAVVAEAVVARAGRILHADAGSGGLVAHLRGLGLDVYGTEPGEAAAAEAADAHLEVRFDDALRHLRRLPAEELAALVLSGCVDRLPAVELLDLADEAARVLVPGGTIVVVSTTPAAWGRDLGPVEADLATGRPFHPETWTGLLAARGFAHLKAHTDRPGSYAVTGVRTGPSGQPPPHR